VKSTRKDEPVRVVTYICMETTQGNSVLCSYLYFKLAKCHASLIIFYVFSSTKLENRKVKQVLPWQGIGWVLALVGEGGGKKGRRINTVQIMYVHVCKCKDDTC
jgi:hypothetical protein